MAGLGLKMIARAPGLKRIPILRLLAIADIYRLARNHANKLTQEERQRVFDLLKKTKGQTGNLTKAEQDELKALVLKAEPRLLVGESANMISPIPIPKRIRQGKKKPAAAAADKSS
jgi:hypothetical protein